jgi:tetratricopeptide (TPR) repeat protein
MIRLLAALFVVASIATTAIADPSPDVAAHLKSATVHFTAGRYAEALADYQAAYKIDPDPDTLFAIAQSERKLGQCHLALPHYRQYLASRSDFPAEIKPLIAECWMQLPPPEANKPCPSAAPTVETGLPWYKNPASGAVIVGTVGLGVGIGFLIAASSSRDKANNAQYSDDFDSLLDEATGRRRIGVTFLVTGALLVGGGVAYHYWTRSPSASPTMALATDGHSVTFARSF